MNFSDYFITKEVGNFSAFISRKAFGLRKSLVKTTYMGKRTGYQI